MKVKNIIVGAGLSGIVLANKIATELNQEVLIIEQRNHIGGNCYDYTDENGILIHKYGLHAFHTNYEDVWTYLNNYAKFNSYVHETIGYVDGKFINIPFNLNSLFYSFPSVEAESIYRKLFEIFKYGDKVSIDEIIKTGKDRNVKEIKILGKYIYENIFKNYSYKQWGFDIKKLDKEILSRIPVVLSHDNRYFHDIYQGMPIGGYTSMFEKMLDNKNIKILLNKNFVDIREKYTFDKLIFTGTIDEYYNFIYGELPYRNTKFVFEEYNIDSYQQKVQVNYPNDYNYTRITEFKKFYPENKDYKINKTVILKEIPGLGNVKCYPMKNKKNLKLYDKYLELSTKEKNVYFLGRLGNYKYLNMDQAIKNVFDFFIKNLFNL